MSHGNIVNIKKATRNLYTENLRETCAALSAFTLISAIRLPNSGWWVTYA